MNLKFYVQFVDRNPLEQRKSVDGTVRVTGEFYRNTNT